MKNKTEDAGTISCGEIAGMNEIQSPSINSNSQSSVLKIMSQKDVDEYMSMLALYGQTLDGAEYVAHEEMKKAFARFAKNSKQLEKLRSDIKRLEGDIHNCQGQIDAYSKLLIFAEDERRAKKGK